MEQVQDTGKVAEYRKLRFNSIDELLREVERIVASEQAGTLRRSGNWGVGQIFGHLAAWIDYNWQGFPARPPWFVKLYLRLNRRKFMHEGLPRGVKIPKVEGGTFATQPMSTDEGLARLRRSLARLQAAEPPLHESPAFGPLTNDERIMLNLRHAELHLGYLHP